MPKMGLREENGRADRRETGWVRRAAGQWGPAVLTLTANQEASCSFYPISVRATRSVLLGSGKWHESYIFTRSPLYRVFLMRAPAVVQNWSTILSQCQQKTHRLNWDINSLPLRPSLINASTQRAANLEKVVIEKNPTTEWYHPIHHCTKIEYQKCSVF